MNERMETGFKTINAEISKMRAISYEEAVLRLLPHQIEVWWSCQPSVMRGRIINQKTYGSGKYQNMSSYARKCVID
jgi:surface antigen